MVDSIPPLDPRAEKLFREYLARVDAGEPDDFEAICRANPALIHDLGPTFPSPQPFVP